MLDFVFRIIARIPDRLHPALFGAAAVFVLTAGRVILSLPDFVRRPDARRDALLLVLVGPLLGAAAGLGYSFIGKPLARIRGIGPYLAGLATISVYLGAMLGAIIVTGEKVDGPLLASFAFCTVFFGLIFGHTFFRAGHQPPAP